VTLRAYLPEDLVPLSFGGTARSVENRSDFLAWASNPTISTLGFVPRPVVLSAAAAVTRAPAGNGAAAKASSSSGGYALDIDIAREGREYLFAKLDGDAMAVVSFASGSFFGLLRFFSILLLPAMGIGLLRSGHAKRKLQFIVVSALSLGIVAPFAPPGLLRLLDTAFLGLLLFALFHGAVAFVAFLKPDAKTRQNALPETEGGAA
jgi:hypothetical protein